MLGQARFKLKKQGEGSAVIGCNLRWNWSNVNRPNSWCLKLVKVLEVVALNILFENNLTKERQQHSD